MRLRLWIDRLSNDAERQAAAPDKKLSRAQRKKLRGVRDTLAGNPHGSDKECIRELLATGVVRYCQRLPDLPNGRLPSQIGPELVAFALWPIVLAPRLPADWYESLAEITSPAIARLVAHVRLSGTTGAEPEFSRFISELVDVPYAFGIANLLADLSDPRRGAGALTAVAVAAEAGEPPTSRGGRVLLLWVLGAAGAGVIGNRADALDNGLWEWIEQHVDGAHHVASSGDHDGAGGDHQQGNHHAKGDGLISFVEHLF